MSAGTRVRFVPLDDADFVWLWSQGFFSSINEATGAMLDDYEEDEIPPEEATTVAQISVRMRGGAPTSVQRFLKGLQSVCSLAAETNYPLLFVL